ncbi:MAG: hypothetical protein AB1467_02855 [Candidatus Diapherotrites archaeon]
MPSKIFSQVKKRKNVHGKLKGQWRYVERIKRLNPGQVKSFLNNYRKLLCISKEEAAKIKIITEKKDVLVIWYDKNKRRTVSKSLLKK